MVEASTGLEEERWSVVTFVTEICTPKHTLFQSGKSNIHELLI